MIPFAALVAACSSSAPRSSATPETRLGTYHFVERVLNGPTLEGQFTVRRDTIVVDMTPGPCRYEERASHTTAIVYRCADVTLTFDRVDPVNRSSYAMTVTVREQQRTCTSTQTGPDGKSTCAQRKTETVERDASRTGRLRPQRVS